jgi:predicted ATPase/class 3 adenylate cyclase
VALGAPPAPLDLLGESSHHAEVAGLPTGTVTFLFTDVEGSTRLLHELGDAYADVLAAHRRCLRDAFARHNGVEVDTQGDAFFVAFAKSTDALAAAADGRDALADGPIRVRMGLHTGEPLLTDEGYVGIDVHRAARIAAAGHGGQILVSQSTRDLAGVDSLRELGEHRLKDLTAPERIYQLGDEEFPPLKSLNATNLPVAANALVGRQREVADLTQMLRDGTRLLTLTGSGGSGKTRLGLQVAAELVEDFEGGVFFVPLAEVGDADLVEGTIAMTIGVRGLSDLRDREALVVVDNFEHVLAAAPAISELLAVAARARVLVTSRAPLRLDAEQEYPVEPLSHADAVELLTQRARAVRSTFEPTPAAAEICARLDGLPLALELAASRLRSLDSDALLARLDARLPLLTSGRRDAPARQRTLRATIEWSYELLPDDLRQVFARLAQFAGTFSLESAETVVDATFDDLDALVETSLIKPVGSARFLMLETIREYAAVRLAEGPDFRALARRHAEHYLEVARSTNLSEEAQGRRPQHELAVAELPNFRKALEWAVEGGDPALGLRLMLALEQFWVAQDPFEGRLWLERLLPRADDVAVSLRARSMLEHGGLVFIVGEFTRGTEINEESLALFRNIGDDRGAAEALSRLIYSALVEGNLQKARLVAEESLELHRRFENALGEAVTLGSLADVEWRSGNHDVALQLAQESIELIKRVGFDWWESGQLARLGEWLLELGRPTDADRVLCDAVAVSHRAGARMHRVYCFALLARIAAESGDPERGGLLWAAVELDEEAGPIGQWEEERDAYSAPVMVHAGAEFDRGLARGRGMTLGEIVAVAVRAVD